MLNLMPHFSSDAMMISICLKLSQPLTSLAVRSGDSTMSSRMNTSWKISVSVAVDFGFRRHRLSPRLRG